MGFFGLLSYDLWWIQLSHAPRYGAGGFNVPHLAPLGALTPTPGAVGALYLVSGALALLAALGVGGRAVVALLAALYGYVYLWSQADSYQHHYLLVLLLALLSWAPLGGAGREAPPRAHASYDALVAQLALIYLWTGVAKLDAAWLSGDTLSGVLQSADVRAAVVGWGGALGLSAAQTFEALAWAVALGELGAAVALTLRRLRPLAFFVVPWFHISVEWVGFDIELFSYYMLALNLVWLSPAALWRPLDALLAALRARLAAPAPALAALARPPLRLTAWLAAAVVAGRAVGAAPAEGAPAAGLLTGALVALAGALSGAGLPRAVAVAAAAALSLGALRASEFGFDYYRMWGGDLRRRGDLEGAARAYERANALKPHGPARHAALGETYAALGRHAEAAAAYEEEALRRRDEALAAPPRDARARAAALDALSRAYQGWAGALDRLGQGDHARFVREQLSADRAQLLAPPAAP
ncbi:MAG: hypothetical protein FJ138_18645 [Deltaproteobacteria bacterium]|nr:hypothetical protein [Deltaproteobacteria bacterium]